jgi:hypothetical protein
MLLYILYTQVKLHISCHAFSTSVFQSISPPLLNAHSTYSGGTNTIILKRNRSVLCPIFMCCCNETVRKLALSNPPDMPMIISCRSPNKSPDLGSQSYRKDPLIGENLAAISERYIQTIMNILYDY